MRKELRVSTIYHSQYPVYNTLLDIERTMKRKKNAVSRGQHWNGSDFVFRKQRKYYKYIQITKGKFLRILKRYSLQEKKRDKILYTENWNYKNNQLEIVE